MAPAATRRTVLAGGATLLAGGAAAQQATPLRLYSLGYATEAATLAFEVPRRTGGRYQVERIIGFDALEATLGKERVAGGERALLEGARSGDLDLVISSALVLGEYLPEALVFFVPFLFRDYAHARAVLDGPIGQDVLARLAAPGPVGLAWTELGLRYVTTNKRAIQAPEDLRGLKLRVSQNAIAVETFRTLGAEAVPMPLGRALLDALTQGALDGAEFDVSTILEWEVFRSQQYLSLTGHIYAPAIILMSKVVYDRLSDADRQAFVEAAQVAVQNGRKDTDNAEATGFAQLVGTGMKINTDVDKAAFRAELAPAYAKWREQFGDLIDRIQAYQ